MKERFISFQTPMVRAEREGRKNMTRRIMKPQPIPQHHIGYVRRLGNQYDWAVLTNYGNTVEYLECPYGKPGDILKVREAAWMWCEKVRDGKTKKGNPKFRYIPVSPPEGGPARVLYPADFVISGQPADRFTKKAQRFGYRLKIPRYLPSWAVRTRLQVVSIRVERLQDISEEDAKAEGAIQWWLGSCRERLPDSSAKAAFEQLWRSINGPESWAANPFVWVITFKRA